MRVAVFVAVLAAHIVLIWLFLSLRRWVLLPVPEAAVITPIFLPPVPEPAIALPFEPADAVPWRAPLPYHSTEVPEGQGDISRAQSARREVERLAREVRPDVASQATSVPEATASDPGSQLASLLGPPPENPDWRAQAELTAQTSALQIVEAEDGAERRAAALMAHFKPLPGPRVRGPEFGWDYAHTHRITPAEGGGLIIALNDRCAIFIFLLPMIGCSIGHQPPANGDLFKYMHKPVKFGDWDWRLDDP